MSNENVLLFLYEKLFPATSFQSQSTGAGGFFGGAAASAHSKFSNYNWVNENYLKLIFYNFINIYLNLIYLQHGKLWHYFENSFYFVLDFIWNRYLS